ncbi:hypothetical protein ACFYXQ_32510 [Nocardia jiangxiensis]|uniref:Uncharacterized protein n=1 Tax=Nocardia jiangxiensis TaxID=282685 RepID=A0ABW6S8C1_9NOCA
MFPSTRTAAAERARPAPDHRHGPTDFRTCGPSWRDCSPVASARSAGRIAAVSVRPVLSVRLDSFEQVAVAMHDFSASFAGVVRASGRGASAGRPVRRRGECGCPEAISVRRGSFGASASMSATAGVVVEPVGEGRADV